MNTEAEFDIPRENRENLKELSGLGCVISERRICELAELADSFALAARELFDTGLDAYEVLSLMENEIFSGGEELHSAALEESRPMLAAFDKSVAAQDKSAFAALFTDRLKSLGVKISESAFLNSDFRDETFIYVKNPYSDEAYDVFSQNFENPRLKYCTGFKDAARAVADSECAFALLPLEESGGTRLPTVSELIFKYDLKICAVTPVFGPDGASVLKYALVAKSLLPPEYEKDDDRYLEIRISQSSSALSDVMLAAETYGIEIYRINTESFSSANDAEAFFTVVFRGEGCDFTKLLVYLTLFTADFAAVGMYKNLE